MGRKCEYLFPGASTSKPRVDLKRPWAAIQKAARLDGVRLHDLRHSYASVLASGVSLHVIGHLLGHTRPAQRCAMLTLPTIRCERQPRLPERSSQDNPPQLLANSIQDGGSSVRRCLVDRSECSGKLVMGAMQRVSAAHLAPSLLTPKEGCSP